MTFILIASINCQTITNSYENNIIDAYVKRYEHLSNTSIFHIVTCKNNLTEKSVDEQVLGDSLCTTLINDSNVRSITLLNWGYIGEHYLARQYKDFSNKEYAMITQNKNAKGDRGSGYSVDTLGKYANDFEYQYYKFQNTGENDPLSGYYGYLSISYVMRDVETAFGYAYFQSIVLIPKSSSN